jgi:thiamine-phosphate pyrophosphorylase
VTICLVTDRRRLASAGGDAAMRCLLAQVRHAADAGVDLVQIRERDLDAGALASLVREAVAATRRTATRVVVNDRLDVALACAADGVHLRSDSVAIAAVRRLAPPAFLVGRSVHTVEDLASAAGADYVIAGTVFPSRSKPDSGTVLGLDGLQAIVRASEAPVLAIGGIDEDRIPDVAAAGASGVAAIGLFMRGDPAGSCGACALRDLVAHTRARFDRVAARP